MAAGMPFPGQAVLPIHAVEHRASVATASVCVEHCFHVCFHDVLSTRWRKAQTVEAAELATTFCLRSASLAYNHFAAECVFFVAERLALSMSPLSSVAEDLKCAISRELPIDPVTAEDGRVYEREDIETYFKTSSGEQIKSPVNGIMMGKRLLPVIQIRNTIERMINVRIINGSEAKEWKQKMKNQELLQKADHGNVEAMEALILKYDNGCNEEYPALAYKWSRKAHNAGSVLGTTNLGWHLIYGEGVRENHQQGTFYLGIAAARGSNLAAYIVGASLAKGTYGLDVDLPEAKRLLEFSLSEDCAYDTLSMLFPNKEELNQRREGIKEQLKIVCDLMTENE